MFLLLSLLFSVVVPNKIYKGDICLDNSYESVVIVDTGTSKCTGTFISKHILITARHCFKNNTIDKDLILINEQDYRVKEVATFDTKDRLSINNLMPKDFVLIYTEKEFVEFSDLGYYFPKKGSLVFIVGYGIENVDSKDFGTKRYAKQKVKKISRFKGKEDFSITKIFYYPFIQLKTKGAHPLYGDSGGPVFDEDAKLIGISSIFSIIGKHVKKSYYLPIATYEQEIKSKITEFKNKYSK